MKKSNSILKKIIISIFVLVGLFIVDVSLSLSSILFTSVSNDRQINNYTITAHRGGGETKYPENSISAIKSTLDGNMKVDRIEIDIHQTSDSVLVVMHDKSIDRTTTGKGLIKDFTYQELLKYQLYNSDNEEKIPLLEDVIKTIDGKCKLVIELKYGHSFYPDIEKRTVDMIKKYNAEEWCIIHSFDDDILQNIHILDTSIFLHKLLFVKLKFLPIIIDNKVRIKTLEDYQYVDEFSIFYLFANKEVIDKSQKMNKKINAWTVNNNEKKKKLLQIGVNGVITDFP
jgi:glycerophosphoryl diester phosphodiesterase